MFGYAAYYWWYWAMARANARAEHALLPYRPFHDVIPAIAGC